MHSCLYAGKVQHRRFQPITHRFRYSLFMVYLDLDELDTVFAPYWLWAVERPNVASLRRKDHMRWSDRPLAHAVRDLVEQRLGARPDGPIRLLTHLRYFGYCFNPVSFYYCYDRDDTQVETIVAEVHNTPWHEEHYYVLGQAGNLDRVARRHQHCFPKGFHVSPFMAMDYQYDWRFTDPGDALTVHMASLRDGVKAFDATMALRRRPITSANLARTLLRHPIMTAKVTAAIHWQALWIWLKGAGYFYHPDSPRNPKNQGV